VTDSFVLILDTAPPSNPSISLNGGADYTGDQIVQARLGTGDYDAGQRDVLEMKLWGDVDPTADPSVDDSEGLSSWQPYQEYINVKLAPGDGIKFVYAKLRDDVGNETVAFVDSLTLDTVRPVVTITSGVDHARVSKVAGHDTATFSWESNQPFVEYVVRAVPTSGSPFNAGVPILTTHGSTGVAGTGAFAALTPITSAIHGADLEVANPGDTPKVVKVFVRNSAGNWSP
jgi:hypothetical protein